MTIENRITDVLALESGLFGLGNFVALDYVQQEDLLAVADMVFDYVKRKNPKRPLNVYIEANPGAGKSFLVKQVCNAVRDVFPKKKLAYLNYNLSFIRSPSELLAVFREIPSFYVDGQLPVVFFDEIDSKIDGKDSYRYFLTPMFDGKVYENGKEFSIGSSIFFFAASKRMKDLVNNSEEVIREEDQETTSYQVWRGKETTRWEEVCGRLASGQATPREKLRDFVDRIDHVVFLPPPGILPNGSEEDKSRQAHLIAASLLLGHFPETRYVELLALTILSLCVAESPSRRVADSYVFKSSPPIAYTFYARNLPRPCLERYEEKAESSVKAGARGLVQLKATF
jgi:hypothetical protein